MTRFEIRTDRFEFSFKRYKASIPAATPDEIWDWYQQESANDPKLRASFDTLEEAQAVFRDQYASYGSTRAERAFGNTWLLVGDLAWIEENSYTEDGDFDQGGDVYDVSAEGYEPEDREENEK